MKDKRTYTNKKEHGEDMSHENESKIEVHVDLTLLTEQYRSRFKKISRKRKLCILKLQNQLDGTKQIVIEMSATIRQLHTENENLKAEIARLQTKRFN
jgi:cell division protein FtsB